MELLEMKDKITDLFHTDEQMEQGVDDRQDRKHSNKTLQKGCVR